MTLPQDRTPPADVNAAGGRLLRIIGLLLQILPAPDLIEDEVDLLLRLICTLNRRRIRLCDKENGHG
jgi:hypothetical protein